MSLLSNNHDVSQTTIDFESGEEAACSESSSSSSSRSMATSGSGCGCDETTHQRDDQGPPPIPVIHVASNGDTQHSTSPRSQIPDDDDDDDDDNIKAITEEGEFLMEIVASRCQLVSAPVDDDDARVSQQQQEQQEQQQKQRKAVKKEGLEIVKGGSTCEVSVPDDYEKKKTTNTCCSAETSEIPRKEEQDLLPGAYAVEGLGSAAQQAASADAGDNGTLDNNTADVLTPANPSSCTSIDDAILVERRTNHVEEDLHCWPNQEEGNVVMPTRTEEEDSGEVIDGTILPERHDKRQQPQPRKGFVYLFFVVLVGVLVLIPVLLLSPSSSSTSSSDGISAEAGSIDNTEEESAATYYYPPYTSDLEPDVLSRIQDINSSLYKANRWMLQDPNLETYSLRRQKQRFSMAVFFYEFGGPGWFQKDWLSYTVGECDWFSRNSTLEIRGWNPGMESEPTCNDDGQLKVLNLTNNNLRTDGSTRAYYSVSSNFKILDLSHNYIKGGLNTIQIGGPSGEMQVFDFSYNQLVGQVRGGGGMQPQPIRIIRLDGNELVGMNPFICILLPHLEVLSTIGNPLKTELGVGYAACRNMTQFVLANTAIHGTIPADFGTLQKLREFNISGNPKITGTIPMELSTLSTLTVLDISGTAIKGTIPQLLCDREEEGLLEIAANCSMVTCCSRTGQ